MLNKLPPLAGPVDASEEPDLRRLIAEWRSHAADSRSQLAKAFKDALVICADELEAAIAAAVPSSPAQPHLTATLRALAIYCFQKHGNDAYLYNALADLVGPEAMRGVPSPPAQACQREIMRSADDSAAYLSVKCTCGKCLTSSSPVADSDEIDEEEVPHPFNSRTRYEPGDDRDIWCADCEYHRDHKVHTSAPSPSAGAAQESEIKNTTGI